MANLSRFVTPVEMARPRYSHRLEVFSPKLNRRLRLYDRGPFECWLKLESDPQVKSFCERPGHLNETEDPRLIDFWVCFDKREEFWILELESDSSVWSPPRRVDVGGGESIVVRQIQPQDLLAWRITTQNWEKMLPYMSASRDQIDDGLLKRVLNCVRTPRQLATIERELSPTDPMLVRAILFSLLHSGTICAPSLDSKPLTHLTQFVDLRSKR